MTDLAKLVVRLEAESSRLTSELERTQRRLQTFDRDVESVAGRLAKRLALPGAAAAIGLIVSRNLEAIASYQDLSDKIGDTASNISKLKSAADISGTAFDTIAAASIKLTSTLSKQDEDSKGAAQALRALGLDFNAFKAQAPVEQLGTLADALAGFRNDASKTAVAVALFGKSGAEILPFLNDLAEDTKRQAVLTQEQVAAADEYAKAIDRLKSRTGALAQQYTATLAPVLLSTVNSLTDIAGAMGSVRREGDALAGQNTLVTWAQSLSIGVAIAAEAIVGVIKTVNALGGSLSVVAADAAVFGQTLQTAFYLGLNDDENAQLGALLEERNRTLVDANKTWADLWNYNGTAVSDSLRRQFSGMDQAVRKQADFLQTVTGIQAQLKGVTEANFVMRQLPSAMIPLRLPEPPSVDLSGLAGGGAGGEAAQKMIQSLRDQNAVLGLSTTQAELYRIKLTEGVTPAQIKLAEALLRTRAAFEQQTAVRGFLDTLKQQNDLLGKSSAQADLYRLKLMDGVTPAQLKLADSLLKTREAFEQKTAVDQFIAGLQQQKDLLGLSSSEAAIYQLRLMDGVTPAQLAQARALQASIDAFQAQADAQRESAAIFEQTRTPVEKYIARIQELQGLLARGITAGGIDQSTFDRAVAQSREAFEASRKAGEESLGRLSTFADEASRGMQQSLANAIRTGFDDGIGGAAASFAGFLADAAAQAAAANIAEAFFGKRGTKDDDGGLFGKAADFVGGLFGGDKPAAAPAANALLSGGTAPVPVTLVGAAGIGGGLFGGGAPAPALGSSLLGAGGIGGSLFGGGGGEDAGGALAGMIGGDLLKSFEDLTAASSAFGAANASVFGSSAELAGGLAERLLNGPGAAFTSAGDLASQFFAQQAAGIASSTAASTAAAATTAATATATNTAIAASAAPAAALTSIASFGGAALAAAAAIPLVTTAISALIGGFAEGGRVTGPGTGTSDSILARLSNREFVLPALAADRIGNSALELLRRGDTQAAARLLAGDDDDNLPAFASGGRVGDGARFAEPAAAAALARDAVLPDQKAPVVNLRVIQVASMEEAKGFLGSEEGGQAVVTQLRKNRGAVRAALGV